MYLSNKAEHSPGLSVWARVAGWRDQGTGSHARSPTRQPRAGGSEPRALRHDGLGLRIGLRRRDTYTRGPVPAQPPTEDSARHCRPRSRVREGDWPAQLPWRRAGFLPQASSQPSPGLHHKHGLRNLRTSASTTRGSQHEEQINMGRTTQANASALWAPRPHPTPERKPEGRAGSTDGSPARRGPTGPGPDRACGVFKRDGSRSSRTSVLGSGTFPPHGVYGPPQTWAWGIY